jgi:tetratricopeptide (TPR) repeat protein
LRVRRYLWGFPAALLAAGCATEAPQPAEPPPIPSISPREFSGAATEQVRAALAALQAAPQNATRNGELGMLLDAYGRTEAAAVLYERARMLDPGALRWRYYLGSALLSQGEPERAIEAFRDAVAADPEFLPARLALASALYAAGQIAESRKLYEEILTRDEDNARALFGVARILSAEGDAAAAIAKLERAVQVAPRYGAAHYELALAYRDAGREADSRLAMARYEADRDAVPADDPLRAQVLALRVDATTRLARAAQMEQRGDLAGALAEHLAALEEEPEFAQAHINLISLYARTGDKAKAREHGEKALAIAPERAELHYNLGVLEVSEGRISQAEKAFRKAVELNPNYAAAMTNLGQMLEARKKYGEATELYRKAVAAQPDYPLARFHLGRMLLAQDKAADAAEQFRIALQPETPQTAEIWMGMAAALARQGRRGDARRAAERAKELALRYGRQELASAVDRELERLR